MVKVTASNQSFNTLLTLSAKFIAESYLLGDHFTHLAHATLPDSQIAKAFKSAHTNTTCVVTGALNPFFAKPVVVACLGNPFSILCDGGTVFARLNAVRKGGY